MQVNSFYPVIRTDSVAADAHFYQDYLGFQTTFVSDWYISMIDENGNELAVMDGSHPTIPEGHRGNSTNILLNFEVEEIQPIYEQLKANPDVTFLLDLKTEDFGQEHFIILGPNDILIDIIKVIPPSEEYQANYE